MQKALGEKFIRFTNTHTTTTLVVSLLHIIIGVLFVLPNRTDSLRFCTSLFGVIEDHQSNHVKVGSDKNTERQELRILIDTPSRVITTSSKGILSNL